MPRPKLTCRLALCLLLLTAGPALAGTIPGLAIEGGLTGWYHFPAGQISRGGAKLDLASDLDVPAGVSPGGWLGLEHPLPFLPDVRLTVVSFAASGESVLDHAAAFGPLAIRAGDTVKSDLSLFSLAGTFYYHLPFVRTASLDVLDITLGLDLNYLNGRAKLDNRTTGLDTSQASAGLVPRLYLGFRLQPVETFALVGEGKGFFWGGQHWLEFMSAVRFFPLQPYLFIGLGYRYVSLEVDAWSPVDASGSVGGFFGEIGVRF